MAITYRTLFVGDRSDNHEQLLRFLEGSDIHVDDVVPLPEVIGRVAQRAPDCIVFNCNGDTESLSETCRMLRTNPATMLIPLVAFARSSKHRSAVFDAGVDDFLTPQISQEETVIRIHALLRSAATRRQQAAEQLAEESRRHELVRATFRRYISPKLADRILDNPELRDNVLAGGHSNGVAVMFADMRGFTTLSEKLPPKEVVELLNEFFALLTDITFEYEGTVFNMAGDSLMVGFGVPVEQADGPLRAIMAARQMLLKFGVLADNCKARHGMDIGLGIGINVGEVVAGNIGSPAYMNYTIIGDTVNVASRLGQRARAGEMLFSEAVKRAIDQSGVNVAALSLPALLLRGRSNPIDAFCIPSGQRIDFRTH